MQGHSNAMPLPQQYIGVIIFFGVPMKRISLLLVFLIGLSFTFHPAHAQTNQPLILVMNANGTIEPAMQEYFERGIHTAEGRNAEALIIQLDTPGGDLQSMDNIIQDIRSSTVPVVVYVAPNSAMAGSAGALITISADVAAMAPEAAIGASSPIDSSGQNLDSTLATKQKEIMKATIRPLVERRGADATQLAQDMIDNAKAVSASEALQAHLIDFTATDVNDVIKKLDGFTVTMPNNGTLTLHTANATVEPLDMNVIEQLLLILTNSNITFILLSLGAYALLTRIIPSRHMGVWIYRRGVPVTGNLWHGSSLGQLVWFDFYCHRVCSVHSRYQSANAWCADRGRDCVVYLRRVDAVQLTKRAAIPASVCSTGCCSWHYLWLDVCRDSDVCLAHPAFSTAIGSANVDW